MGIPKFRTCSQNDINSNTGEQFSLMGCGVDGKWKQIATLVKIENQKREVAVVWMNETNPHEMVRSSIVSDWAAILSARDLVSAQ